MCSVLASISLLKSTTQDEADITCHIIMIAILLMLNGEAMFEKA